MSTFEGLFLLGASALLLLGNHHQSVKNLATVFVGIILEALPFMLLGSLAGGLIEVYISRERLIAWLPKSRWLSTLAAAALGVVCPVCECAVVPVVRRLLGKGIPFPAAVAFLLGAPLVNPIVGASTAVAYGFNGSVALIRLSLGYAIAVAAGLTMGWLFPEGSALIAQKASGLRHDHDGDCDCGCDHTDHNQPTARPGWQRIMNAFRHASADFLQVGHFLVLGAFIAALAQTFIARQSLTQFADSPIFAIVLMMLLAVGLNICSQADAFIAASFRNILPFSAQMAFMLLGPMLDLKLVFMYTGIFRRRAIALFAVVVAMLVFQAVWVLQLTLPGGPR
jgi:uncharacterized membrane protein YraQ (UPF0718 family)